VWDESVCRRFGFRHLAYRSLFPLYRAGCEILKRERYDVVFFSTTVFLCFVLGPLWKRRFGCRIVYDFQDPWYSEQLTYTPETVPGIWWKYRLDQLLARYLERFALKSADHIISVSEGYVRSLTQRYSWLDSSKFTVLPFGSASDDYDFVHRHAIKQPIFKPDGRLLHWVYAGAVASDMQPVFGAFFRSLAQVTKETPEFVAQLRLHFVGTNYAPAARTNKLVESLASEHGVVGLMEEHPERIPYFQALALYEASDALLLVGSISADYTASKLFNCLLAKKPILALFHRRSLVAGIARQFPNVFLAVFDETPSDPEFQAEVARGIEWLRSPTFDVAAIDAGLRPWSAEEMTRAQCAIFDRAVSLAAPSDAELKLNSRAPS
jgi:Glycosyltransferase Family 4